MNRDGLGFEDRRDIGAGVRVTANSGPGGAIAEIRIRIEGDDPDFAKQREALGKELGPGSDIEKKKRKVAEEARAKADEARAKAEAAARRVAEHAESSLKRAQDRAERAWYAEKLKAGASARRRLEAKIAAMEAQIRELGEEVRKLDDDDNR